jgi:hypothetical protein
MYSDEGIVRERLERELGEREGRLAFSVIRSFKNLLDVIDDMSPQTLKGIRDFAADMQHPDSPAPRRRFELQACLINYVERAMAEAEAKAREKSG